MTDKAVIDLSCGYLAIMQGGMRDFPDLREEAVEVGYCEIVEI